MLCVHMKHLQVPKSKKVLKGRLGRWWGGGVEDLVKRLRDQPERAPKVQSWYNLSNKINKGNIGL